MTRFERLSPFYKLIAVVAVLIIVSGNIGLIMTNAFGDSCALDGLIEHSGMAGIGAITLALILLSTARTKQERKEYRGYFLTMILFVLFVIATAYVNKNFLHKPLAGFCCKQITAFITIMSTTLTIACFFAFIYDKSIHLTRQGLPILM